MADNRGGHLLRVGGGGGGYRLVVNQVGHSVVCEGVPDQNQSRQHNCRNPAIYEHSLQHISDGWIDMQSFTSYMSERTDRSSFSHKLLQTNIFQGGL